MSSISKRIVREIKPIVRLMRPAEHPDVWVLGQKKCGTTLAVNFLSHGIYGRPAVTNEPGRGWADMPNQGWADLPVRRWLQRGLLPFLFDRNPRMAVEVIGRIFRTPIVKEPNLCYHVHELISGLDDDSRVVYVTRNRVDHVRSFLDRILERRGEGVGLRKKLNFVWRRYIGDLKPGARLNGDELETLIKRLAQRFDAVDQDCLNALSQVSDRRLVIRYEDIIGRSEGGTLRADTTQFWTEFDWESAQKTLNVQHQPRGARLVDKDHISQVLTK